MNIGWIMELMEVRIIEQVVVDTEKTANDRLMLDSNVWKRKSKIVHFGKSQIERRDSANCESYALRTKDGKD